MYHYQPQSSQPPSQPLSAEENISNLGEALTLSYSHFKSLTGSKTIHQV